VPNGPTRRLDSWKEIAEYLGRDVRTAIRWEVERGLPVHRLPGGKRGGVYAEAVEIEAWLKGASLTRNGFGEGEDDHRLAEKGSAGEAEGPGQARTNRVDAASASPHEGLAGNGVGAPSVPVEGVAETPAPAPTKRTALLRSGAFVLGAGLVILAIVVAVAMAGRRQAAAGRGEAVEQVSFTSDAVVASDRDGRPLWRHEVPEGLVLCNSVSSDAHDAFEHYWHAGRSQRVDLDGDGAAEVLVSVPLRDGRATVGTPFARSELRSYSAAGSLRWKRGFAEDLVFRAGRYSAPWNPGSVASFRIEGKPRIAWALKHQPWWPSILLTLDAGGNEIGRFVHAGNIEVLTVMEGRSGPLLLAGGISNSREAAMLIVLDGRQPFGSGPEEAGSPFECVGCPAGRPLRYFVFPPSEVCHSLDNPYNRVSLIVVESDRVLVRTREALNRDKSYDSNQEFTFSSTLELLHAAHDDSYWVVHRNLEKEGKLDHSDRDCPDRKRPPRVREWRAEVGWRELTPTKP
jgi:hypothetical protein